EPRSTDELLMVYAGIMAHGTSLTAVECARMIPQLSATSIRQAKLVPPPRTHRHRYFGVLAPNSPLRPAVTALARDAAVKPAQVQAEPASTAAGEGALGVRSPLPTQTEPAQPVPPKRPAHYLWAVLMARIYEVFPLLCPICGGQMHIIAFITHSADIRQILEHIGVETEPPHITPARGPPLWDECDAQAAEGVEPAPDWDEATQPAPDFEVDQRVSW
ncbi:transposase, partial [Comamonas sp. Y6]|nr:transposase [Comamonas resistens]